MGGEEDHKFSSESDPRDAYAGPDEVGEVRLAETIRSITLERAPAKTPGISKNFGPHYLQKITQGEIIDVTGGGMPTEYQISKNGSLRGALAQTSRVPLTKQMAGDPR